MERQAWPTEWTAFGTYTITRGGLYGEPVAADLLFGEVLATIPGELTVGGDRLQGLALQVEDGALDLDRGLSPGVAVGLRTAYLMAPITASADTTIQIGAGADWWMQWWLGATRAFLKEFVKPKWFPSGELHKDSAVRNRLFLNLLCDLWGRCY